MKHFKNILFYIGTEGNDAALSRACKLALDNGAKLTLIDVVRPIPKGWGIQIDIADPQEIESRLLKEHRQAALDTATKNSETGLSIEVIVVAGNPSIEIVRQVRRGEHDLVIKTVDEFAGTGRLFGTVGLSLLRTCPCPVWLLKPEVFGPFDCVLAAVDVASETEEHIELNRRIVKLAYSVAKRENAKLHLVTAWDLKLPVSVREAMNNVDMDAALARYESRVFSSLDELVRVDYAKPSDFSCHVKRGRASEIIQKLAAKIEADLMVMGTVYRTRVPGLLIGSTAETVLTNVDCSVLAIKPKGFVCPVEV